MAKHFGVTVNEGKYGLKLVRENYAIINKKSSFNRIMKSCDYEDKQNKLYNDEWCTNHKKKCLENYDLNIEFLSLLDHNEFSKEINKFLKVNNKFTEVTDLTVYNKKPGYYVMVIDEYCQVYVGTTDDIKRRIQQHWSKRKAFDRLLFPIGAVDTSVLSIDSFRAYDTTRIFAYVTDNLFAKEDDYIKLFSPKFVCNRIGGGEISNSLFQAIEIIKKHKLK